MLRLFFTLRAVLLFGFACLVSNAGQSQNQIYANQVILQSNVDNADNALSVNGEAATLNSNGGLAVGVGAFTGELGLQFSQQIPANTTTFVKIEFDEDILSALLGGTLGELLADIAGTVVLGNHFFNVEARQNGSTVLSSSSQTLAGEPRVRVVKGSNGDFFIALTPSQPYNQIYIEDETNNLLLGVSNSMRVFHAFYFENNQTGCNYDPLYTDFDGDGLSLDALDLGGAGVQNPEFAIDANPNNFSQLSLGVAAVTSSVSQNVFFPDVYSPNEAFEITLQTEPTLVTLGLLNAIEVSAFNGEDEVFSATLSSVLNLDLLTLLQNGERTSIPFTPGVSFNRVRLTLNSLVNVNLAQSLDFFGAVALGPQAPSTTMTEQQFCGIDNPTVADLETNENNVVWFDEPFGGMPLDDNTALVDGQQYYAAQIEDGCIGTRRLAVDVIVVTPPAPSTNSSEQVFCNGNDATIADLSTNEPNVIWFATETSQDPLPENTLLEDNTTYFGAQMTDGCLGEERLTVQVTIENPSAPTASSLNQNFCASEDPTLQDIVTNEQVVWYANPTGGSELDNDTQLVDGQTYYASQLTSNGCQSMSRLGITVTLDDLPTPTTSSAQQAFCESNDPTINDLQVNESNVLWYADTESNQALSSDTPLIDGQSYFAALSEGECESTTRLRVDVTLTNVETPTTSNTEQSFCVVDEPTVADLEASSSFTVIWYASAMGGEPLEASTALENNTSYYAASKNGDDCESTERLEVTVTLEDSSAPTVDDNTQRFCAANNPTVEDLMANGNNIRWYIDAQGGAALSDSELLISGETYFASQQPENACESASRTEVLVQLNSVATPTTNNTTQTFCEDNDPTVGDIKVNESNVVWYASEDSDVAFDDSDELIDGQTYFGARQDSEGCESEERLAVNVNVNPTSSPMLEASNQGQACTDITVTFTTDEGQDNYQWSVEGGEIVSGGSSTDAFVDVIWQNEGTYEVSVSYSSESLCSDGQTATFTQNVASCSALSVSKTVDNTSPQIGDQITFTVDVTNSGTVVFDEVIVSEVIQSGFELQSHTTTQGNYDPDSGLWTIANFGTGTATLEIVVEVIATGDHGNTAFLVSTSPDNGQGNGGGNPGGSGSSTITIVVMDVVVNNQISPNGDGRNDVFVIDNLEQFPDNTLKIFNRYGSLVFEQDNYDNTWDGTANVGGLTNSRERLPSETYYYVLSIKEFDKPLTGWLFVAY